MTITTDGEIRQLTIEELAEDAFVKRERVIGLSMVNTPTDFEERKKAFVALAVARKAAWRAQLALESRIGGDYRKSPSAQAAIDAVNGVVSQQ